MEDYKPEFVFITVFNFAYLSSQFVMLRIKETVSSTKRMLYSIFAAIISVPSFFLVSLFFSPLYAFLLANFFIAVLGRISLIYLGTASAISEPTLFSIAGLITPKYSIAIQGGIAFSGLFIAALRALTTAFFQDDKAKGIFIFFSICLLYHICDLLFFVIFMRSKFLIFKIERGKHSKHCKLS